MPTSPRNQLAKVGNEASIWRRRPGLHGPHFLAFGLEDIQEITVFAPTRLLLV